MRRRAEPCTGLVEPLHRLSAAFHAAKLVILPVDVEIAERVVGHARAVGRRAEPRHGVLSVDLLRELILCLVVERLLRVERLLIDLIAGTQELRLQAQVRLGVLARRRRRCHGAGHLAGAKLVIDDIARQALQLRQLLLRQRIADILLLVDQAQQAGADLRLAGWREYVRACASART